MSHLALIAINKISLSVHVFWNVTNDVTQQILPQHFFTMVRFAQFPPTWDLVVSYFKQQDLATSRRNKFHASSRIILNILWTSSRT
jgi:hypothetical protein